MKMKRMEGLEGLQKGRDQDRLQISSSKTQGGFWEILINAMLDMLNLKYVAPYGNGC